MRVVLTGPSMAFTGPEHGKVTVLQYLYQTASQFESPVICTSTLAVSSHWLPPPTREILETKMFSVLPCVAPQVAAKSTVGEFAALIPEVHPAA